MSEQRFEVVFRGDVEPGQAVAEVKEGLIRLFNTDASRIDQMFSGKPVVIKGNLDEETAQHYQASLKKAGALVQIRSMSPESSAPAKDSSFESPDVETANTNFGDTPSEVSTPDDVERSDDAEDEITFDFDVAPVGADVLPSEHKKDFTPAEVDTSHLTVSEVGSDVLDEQHKRDYEDADIDTSHLSVDDSQTVDDSEKPE